MNLLTTMTPIMNLLTKETNMVEGSISRAAFFCSMALGVIEIVTGVTLLIGGAWLMYLGGSAYYLLAGAILGVSGIMISRRQRVGVWLLCVLFALTVIWAFWEVGFEFWPLIPRLVAPAVLTMIAILLSPWMGPPPSLPIRRALFGSGGALLVALCATLWLAFQPHGVIRNQSEKSNATGAMGGTPLSDWTHYGRDSAGTRFANFDQINATNVADLKIAWTYRTGDLGPGEDQNVPLQIGPIIYTCSRTNHVAALDSDNGKMLWQFDPRATSPVWQRCRGLGYFDVSTLASLVSNEARLCQRRIIETTIDARLIALDADTGALCPAFGNEGTVDLKRGMGPIKPGFYFQTSAPTVARRYVIIGGWVRDNQERGEPSGVIRAFDVMTGKLVWAWDLGNPAITRDPPPGESYSRGTPNMWSHPSFDDSLGLLYLPLGNATPDYYGEGRTPESEKFASSIVALDIETGRPRWSVQTVHHDLWDYDVASQPALYDIPDGKGGSIPALLQTTKRGQLFLINRATGEPLAEIVERPVPQDGKVASEWLSKTQPYSIGMPAIGAQRLSETKMWGMTPLDQLWCRIEFRRARYDGDFTPPGLKASIEYPGNYGGFNWGSVSIDPRHGYAFMNDIRLPAVVRLMPPEEAKEIIAKTVGVANRHGPAMQAGTPYGVLIYPMMSPLGIPCNQPPYGTVTAVDLNTRTVAWQVPIGTVEDTGPLGIPTRVPVPIGMPTIGGTLATASGLVFFAGTQDFYIRALNAKDGKELWRHRLPVGSGSTPMTYVSPKTGRQYLLISAGGAPGSSARGDYVIAFSLPH